MDNKFKCSHGKRGFCRRYMKACFNEECRFYNECGECGAYFIPFTQKPCCVCINNPKREKGGMEQ